MVAREGSEPTPMKNQTSMELKADRELIIARTFNGPARIVFDAWTKPELVKRWWAPKSHCVSVVSCDADVRVGGKYRYVLRPEGGEFLQDAPIVEDVAVVEDRFEVLTCHRATLCCACRVPAVRWSSRTCVWWYRR